MKWIYYFEYFLHRKFRFSKIIVKKIVVLKNLQQIIYIKEFKKKRYYFIRVCFFSVIQINSTILFSALNYGFLMA